LLDVAWICFLILRMVSDYDVRKVSLSRVRANGSASNVIWPTPWTSVWSLTHCSGNIQPKMGTCKSRVY